MPAAREQARERRLQGIGLEVERREMPFEVIDRGEGQPASPGEGLRSRDADEQRTDEPRALRDGDPLHALERYVRRLERCDDHRPDELEVTPRSDLRHDAAEPRVELGLRRHDRREQPPVAP